MIHVTKVGDLTFELRFDDKLRQDLSDIASWGSVEAALERILSDIILGYEPYPDFYDDLSDDTPF